jgi:CDP-diacylglycerol--glycerol-3-phosphate 3-phosphatidyltransferase
VGSVEGDLMAVYSLKPAFRRALSPLGRGLIRAGISADVVTLSGVAFAALGGLGVWLGRRGEAWLLLLPLGALLRTAANALDGWIAQETHTSRPLGEVLNETADRVGDVAIFLPVAFINGVPVLLVAGVLSAILVTSFVGVAIKAAGGPRVYAGVMGKPDRMLVMGLAGIAAMFIEPEKVFSVTLWIVLAGVAVTLVQRSAIARREL